MLACYRTSADYNWTRTKLLEYREEEALPREGVLSFWPAPDRGRQQKTSPTCDDKALRYPGSSRRAKSHARRLPRDLPRRPSFDGNLVPSEERTSIGSRFQPYEVSPSFRTYCRYHLYPNRVHDYPKSNTIEPDNVSPESAVVFIPHLAREASRPAISSNQNVGPELSDLFRVFPLCCDKWTV